MNDQGVPVQISETPPEGEMGVSVFVYRDEGREPVFFLKRPASDAPYDMPHLWGPTPDGQLWQSNLKNVARPLPLYRIRTILDRYDKPVIFHRSERDVFAATQAGLAGVHTTSVMGQGYARASDFAALAGRDVVICEDKNPEGESYAHEVASLARMVSARAVEIVRLPGLADTEGVIDWLNKGGGSDEWDRILSARLGSDASGSVRAETTPIETPEAEAPPLEATPVTAKKPAHPARKRVIPAPEKGAFRDLVPLPDGISPVAPFTADLLPEAVRPYVMEVARKNGIAPDYPAAAMVAALGAVIGRRVGIYPTPGKAARVVPTLWAALLYDHPLAMESPAIPQILEPLTLLAADAHAEFVEKQRAHQVRQAAYDAARNAWTQQVEQAARAGKNTDSLLAKHPTAPEPPRQRRYRTSAGSVEKLIALMNDNPRGLMLFRDDLSAWLGSLARTGREGERHFFLACAGGAESSLDYDGGSSGTLHCHAPGLAVLGGAHADIYRKLVTRDTGNLGQLASRFGLTVCPDSPMQPDRADGTDAEGEDGSRVHPLFRRLDSLRLPAGETASLQFDEAAREIADRWMAGLETRLTHMPDLLFAAHLATHRQLLPALALIFHLVEVAEGDGQLRPVTAPATLLAARWCDYLATHAGRLYGTAEAAHVEGARVLLSRLVAGEVASPFKVRDIYRRHWTRLSTPEVAQAAVRVLEQHAYLAATPLPTTERGGKPTRLYHLNPSALDAGAATGTPAMPA